MRRAGRLGACWPSAFQTEVLRAAVSPPAEAAAAWDRLRAVLVLDDLTDPEVHRLLPLVAANLTRAGVDDPDLPRLQGLRRRTWVENELLLHRCRPALDQLRTDGVPIVFLKGVALAVEHLGDLGLRPMQDVDILVPLEHAARALDRLEELGWRDPGEIPRARLFASHHGAGLVHPEGGALDVHWHLGTPLLLPGDEARSSDDLWAAAVPLRDPRHGIDDLTLCPTDHLLHLIAHGVWGGSASTVRWAADAAVVLRGGRIGWSRLVEQATRRRIAPLVADALAFLRDELAQPIPHAPIQALRAAPTTTRERRLLRALTASIEGPEVLGGLPHLRSYWAYTRLKWSTARAARELPGFVVHVWALDRPAQIPRAALARVRRRLDRRGRPLLSGRVVARPTVGVVIPTHHRPDDLRRCLAALAAQEDAPEQVVVVRGPHDTGAADVVRAHPRPVTEVVAEATSQVARLHAGAAVTTTEVVAFTDDDAAPHADWVGRLRAWFRHADVGAVGGRDLEPGAKARGHRTRVGTLGIGGRLVGDHSHGVGPPRDVDHLRGVNLAVRRTHLRIPVGLRGRGAQGYNEVPVCLWVRQAGGRVVYDPALLVDHHLAPRDDRGADGRGAPDRARWHDDAYNQTFALVSLGATRWWARLLYVGLVGDRSTGGLLRGVVGVLQGEPVLLRELPGLWRVHREAIRDARRRPLRGVRPDEPFPATGQ